MKYDFTSIMDRHGKDAIAVDGLGTGFAPAAPKEGFDAIPMWVADMNFPTVPTIQEAIIERTNHPAFGYFNPTDEYFDSIIRWQAKRNSVQGLTKECIGYENGVLGGVISALNCVCSRGDKILVQTPVYNHFFISIRNSGCRTAENDLTYRGGAYTIDFADLERKAADPEVKAMLLCNPHNPAGRVWTPAELHRIGELCLRHDVVVVADEIHCELVMPGFRYTPFASLCEEFERRSVTCTSPSKAFNLAGVQVANIFAADAGLRERIARSLEINETGMISPFAIEALTAAYTDGAEWLDALNGYLWENYLFLRDYFARHLPQFPVLPLEGTYLVWADCRAAGLSSDTLTRRLLDEGRLHVNSGSMYGAAGEGFIRLNIACPRKLLAEGLDRLKRVLTT